MEFWDIFILVSGAKIDDDDNDNDVIWMEMVQDQPLQSRTGLKILRFELRE